MMLCVRAVDREKLAEERVLHYSVYPQFESSVDKPTVGSKFKYIGFESGEFGGAIGSSFDWIPIVAAPEYSFGTYFVILRDENKHR
jgi:hypothetical protein